MSDRSTGRSRHSGTERPTHPRVQGIVLMVAVVIAIVLLAAMSTFGAH